jgi:hypothetical protein
MVQPRCERTVSREVRHALGLLHRVSDRTTTATRDAQEQEPIGPDRVDDRLEIAEPWDRDQPRTWMLPASTGFSIGWLGFVAQ